MPTRCTAVHVHGQGRSPVQRPRSVQRALQPLRRRLAATRAAPARSTRRSASAGLDNRDQTRGVQQHADAVVAHRQRDARADSRTAICWRCSTDPDRAGGEHCRRRHVRHVRRAARPGAATRCIRSSTTSRIRRGAHALRVGRRLPLQRRHDHVSALGARRLHVLVAGELSLRHVQQRRLHADVRRERRVADQPERRRLRAGRVEGGRRA